MEQQGSVVIAGGRGAVIDPRELRRIRGPLWGTTDLRFTLVVVTSIFLHGAGLYYVHSLKLPAVEPMKLERIPERFARLIVEKPMPREDKKKPVVADKGRTNASRDAATSDEPAAAASSGAPSKVSAAQRSRAQRTVAAREAKVAQTMRTVGVLGMLSGVGSTARGPAVVDVLGAVGDRKERYQDLEKALNGMTGLKQTQDVGFVERKLVKSKDVTITNNESINNLIQDIGAAKTSDLAKQGNIVIQKPEAIEGAASASAKRDSKVINDVVLAHKSSIRMSYEKFLKRDPALSGKITLRFTISAAGTVSSVEVLENTTGSQDLEQEIARKVSMWEFEAVPEGDATVTYPFVFRPS